MHRAIHQYRHDLGAQRTLCRLECGHSVLCHDDVQPCLCLGQQVRCQVCARASVAMLKPGWLYQVFLRDNPSVALLSVFVRYRWCDGATIWRVKGVGLVSAKLSEIAAVELV